MAKDSQRQLGPLGKKIREQRLKKKLSQEQLAERAMLDRTYISLVERGRRNPSYLNLLKIARGLEVRLGALIDQP